MRLPHNPGRISNQSWSTSSRPISQDLTRGVIVGQENYTGRAIAFDGSGTVAADSDIEPELGAGVDIVRPNSVEKARSTTLRWITRTLRSPGGGSFTNSQPSDKDVRSCGESGTGGGGYTFPSPPEEPQEPPEEVVEEVQAAYASSPRACQPKPPTIVRPRQQDQYYYVDSIDAPCPLGMIKAGFVELPNGDIMIQCKAPKPPPGDGVPSDPTAWGYDCSSCGTCIPVQGGRYPTLEICQQSGCKPVTYQCTPTGCVPVYDGSGNFATLAACQNSCSAVPYDCIDGDCVQTIDGKYATLEECQAICSPPTQIATAIELVVRPNVIASYICGIVPRTGVSFVREVNPSNPAYGIAYFKYPTNTYPTDGCAVPLPNLTYLGILDLTSDWHMLFNSDQGQFSIFVATNDTFPFNRATFTPIYE